MLRLSICIPTYNRGKRAFELVESLMPLVDKYSGELEIIVSNNGSTIETEYYQRIEALSNSCGALNYHEFEVNRYYVSNFNQVIKMSKAQFCLLISDEDRIDFAVFDKYMDMLSEGIFDAAAIVRARTSAFYSGMNAGCFVGGSEAIEQYFMLGNYISGIIYNRQMLTDEVVDALYDIYGRRFLESVDKNSLRESDIWKNAFPGESAYFYYPHMFADGYLLAEYGLIVQDMVLIIEGKDANDVELVSDTQIKVYATYEQRLDQFKGFLGFIDDYQIPDGVTLSMVKNLVLSTVLLIKHVRRAYEQLGKSWMEVCEFTVDYMARELAACRKEIVSKNTAAFMQWAIELLYN